MSRDYPSHGHGRPYEHRSRVDDVRHATKTEREAMREDAKGIEKFERPTTRADCVDGPRPCPFVSCRFHLYLESLKSGNVLMNRPELVGPEELEHSCVLDLTDIGSYSLEDTGRLLNITRERVRQIEAKALRVMRANAITRNPALLDFVPANSLVRKDDRDGDWRRAPLRSASPTRVRLRRRDDADVEDEDEKEAVSTVTDEPFVARDVWDLSIDETPLRLQAASDKVYRSYMNGLITKGVAGVELQDKFTKQLATIEAKLAGDAGDASDDADEPPSTRKRSRSARVRSGPRAA